jgi:hypothetical protein
MTGVKTTCAISKGARSSGPEHAIPKCGFSLIATLAAAFFVLAGCGGGNGTNITSITISPTTTNVPINTQEDFTAVVNLANSTNTTTTTVTWEVNGTAGGSTTLGTIVSSATDSEVGVYTAPAVVPTTNNGEVSVTAVVICQSGISGCQSTTTSSTTSTTTITSNTATVTITAGLGLSVSPTTATVPSGGTFQFSAVLNGLTDSGATWSLSSANGGTLGSIDATGLYTAPLNPPPGSAVTVTATDPTSGDTATATATIVFSDRSLNGPYAFSYTGNDQSGFLAVAGSFVANGKGGISSGVEDIDSFLNGVAVQVPITGGTYVVGSDGRGTAMVTTGRGNNTWDFALANNQQGQLTRFDSNVTGGGTIAQQNLNFLGSSLSVISGPYVFNALGANGSMTPMGIAGAFSANGSGTIPPSNAILDVNNNGTVTTSDTSLQGTYSLDSTFPGTGRGILTLTSTTIGSLQYSFYIIDDTRLYLIETDSKDFLAGAIYSAPTGPSFSVASLAAGNYAFASGGNSGSGAYATGGVFTSDGNGNVTGGVQDINNAGTTQLATALGSCPYTVSSNVPRVDLKLFPSSGTCSVGSTVNEFATYLTAQGSAVMLKIDTAAIATGTAFQQSSLAAFTAGGFGMGLSGQGVFFNNSPAYQPDISGQLLTSGSSITGGNLDINNFNATFQSNPIATTGTSIGSPDSTHGRGTLVLQANNPTITLNLIYYVVSPNTALLFDQDQARVAIGSLNRQF